MLLRGDIDLAAHLEGDGEGIFVYVALGIGDDLLLGSCLGLVTVVPRILDGGVVLPAGGEQEEQSRKEGAQAQKFISHLTGFLLSF
jgi:hypothetical protein